ncbi:hypothetical protein ACH5RR_013851 [Cinchona calisaya]|uniref:non-specific serine/threonine protein kinase n=1 Tax=Cinchona calisaya TaxID=153742 RepID=A0ABD3A169_9GENT
MHHPDRLPTAISLFLTIINFTLTPHIPKTFGQDQQFTTCGEPFRCGNFNFTYPFWGGNNNNNSRPESCGYPGFNLSCQENVPRFTVEPLAYRILQVDYSSYTLTVAREDLWADFCPQFIHDSGLNVSIFRYSNNIRNIYLFYNCTGVAISSKQQLQQNKFSCTVNRTTTTNLFLATDILPYLSCTNTITVPVNKTRAGSLETSTANDETLRQVLIAGFTVQYVANNSVCTDCRRSGGRCGYNTISNSFACYCSDRTYDMACNQNGMPSPSNGRIRGTNRINLVTGLIIGVVGIILAVCIICCLAKSCSLWEALICWKLDDGNSQHIEAFMRNFGSIAPKHYNYSELKRITNSFVDKLGQGGYGSVYRGKLSDGRQVAVKLLNDNKGNGEEFINEVASISRTSHINVVTLLGFCYNRNRRALIYEFMPNGSLDGFICKKLSLQDHTTTECRLEWKTLYKISVGIARGLEYLHGGCNTRIVHFDIKPHNILLDKDFCPKISDFGLAKLCESRESILSMNCARGTIGYIAPEVFCRNFGGVSHKSDVYSYGMVLLEIVGMSKKIETGSIQLSGEKFFPNWIYEHLERGKDLEIQDATYGEEEENSRKMTLVGLWCIQTNPADRPSMSRVVEMLEGSPEHLQIPPKPFLDSPPVARKSIQESWTSSIS